MTPRSEGETDASRALKSALLRMHAATVLFGLSGIFGKLCSCSPAMLVCGRAFFAVGALSLLCLARRHAPWQGLRCRELAGLALSGTLLTVHFVTFFMGIQLGGVAVGTLGFACFPAFTTLFEALAYREKPSGREYACMFLVSCGLALITPSFSLADATTAGLAWGACFPARSTPWWLSPTAVQPPICPAPRPVGGRIWSLSSACCPLPPNSFRPFPIWTGSGSPASG